MECNANMKTLEHGILTELILGSGEPLMVARIDHPEWPIVFVNPAMEAIGGDNAPLDASFADVMEQLVGRDLAMEISEAARAALETTIAVEHGGRDFLLVMRPLAAEGEEGARYYATYWRSAAGSTPAADADIQQALLKARRRLRDLSRDDPVTGLLNARSFAEVLAHDWAVAAREQTRLALVAFTLDDFAAYVEVFGKHAADSCQRRVAQAIRRCLRRASDVAARLESDGDPRLVVLSHSSEEKGVSEFAARIATNVRELGLHHPRSRSARFVTVSWRTSVMTAGVDADSADAFLDTVLD